MSDKEANTEAKSATKDTQVSSNVQFPFRLHEMLDEVDSSIISWVPTSNAFKVHDKVTFTEKTLPQYFNATKYKSFQRNLNLWGFQTIQEGPNKGACFHPLFIKDNREKVHYMTRQKVKGTGGKSGSKASGKTSLLPGPQPSLADIAVATNPGLITALKEAKTTTYTDEELKALPFMKKLHHILGQPEFGDSIQWTPDGRCIRVVDPFKFLDITEKKYFDFTSFSSFLVELEAHGFKKVTHLGISECYYHDLMIRGCHYLCKYMEDKKSAKKWISEDPAKDLEIDQAFGIPALLPASIPPVNPNAAAAVEVQRQQQLAALQNMMGGMISPGMATMGGLNPAILQAAPSTPTGAKGKEKGTKKKGETLAV